MTNQMSEQMDISKTEASELMERAKMMNDMGMKDGGFPDLNKDRKITRKDILLGRGVEMADGGMARVQGTPPAQVKGFTYNDNGGKGTF